MIRATVESRAHAVLSALLETHTGQPISSGRAWRIETELLPLLRDYGVATPDELVDRLLRADDPALTTRIVDALINQETSFFRDPATFDLIAEAVDAMGLRGRRARIWSAACAAGQEPLSLAMMFAERAGPLPEIVASDVSKGAMLRASTGRFSQFEVQRGLPIRRLIRWFSEDGAGWTVDRTLLQAIAFRRINLVADPLPAGRFDLVLCRNVLMYFPAAIKAEVLARVAATLRPGGLLLLGAGETVAGGTRLFEASERFRGFYERTEVAIPVERASAA